MPRTSTHTGHIIYHFVHATAVMSRPDACRSDWELSISALASDRCTLQEDLTWFELKAPACTRETLAARSVWALRCMQHHSPLEPCYMMRCCYCALYGATWCGAFKVVAATGCAVAVHVRVVLGSAVHAIVYIQCSSLPDSAIPWQVYANECQDAASLLPRRHKYMHTIKQLLPRTTALCFGPMIAPQPQPQPQPHPQLLIIRADTHREAQSARHHQHPHGRPQQPSQRLVWHVVGQVPDDVALLQQLQLALHGARVPLLRHLALLRLHSADRGHVHAQAAVPVR